MYFERYESYSREVRKDALKEAAKERLINQIRAPRAPVQIPYQLWIARLGEQMVLWGRQLQSRYASMLPSAVSIRMTPSSNCPR